MASAPEKRKVFCPYPETGYRRIARKRVFLASQVTVDKLKHALNVPETVLSGLTFAEPMREKAAESRSGDPNPPKCLQA